MASIKDYNRKLKSLTNTRKITKTMKMVAASKLRKAYELQTHAKLYAQNITGLISRISTAVDPTAHPLLEERKKKTSALLILFTSDRGLCGSFNHNAISGAERWVIQNANRFEKIDIACCGRYGFMYFQSRVPIRQYYENITTTPKFLDAKRIGDDVSSWFTSRKHDEVYLAFNQFFNPLSQRTVVEKILPIDAAALLHEKKAEKSREYLFEPPAPDLLGFLIPYFIYFKIYFTLLENSAGEHGARMTAMDNATRNASDLIDRYTLLRNRARQAEITVELTEIVAGAEALK